MPVQIFSTQNKRYIIPLLWSSQLQNSLFSVTVMGPYTMGSVKQMIMTSVLATILCMESPKVNSKTGNKAASTVDKS